jgi:hypothetical protein
MPKRAVAYLAAEGSKKNITAYPIGNCNYIGWRCSSICLI